MIHQNRLLTVALLFTDIDGSTALWRDVPEMPALLAAHDTVLEAAFAAHGGRVFNKAGDGYCVSFLSPTDAIAAALEGQRALLMVREQHQRPDFTVRMAIHVGEVIERAHDFLGTPLAYTRRLLDLARGGQVLVSRPAATLASQSLPSGASLEDVGQRQLRDMRSPEHIFRLRHPDLAAPDIAEDVRNTASTNLPVLLTSFIGREALLRDALGALHAHRLVTLVGAGGCGKTRLALRTAEELLGSYPDGVWFVSLEAVRDPQDVPFRVCAVLQVGGTGEEPMPSSACHELEDKQLLLILDNCEHLLEACRALLGKMLTACPGVSVLATSRELLGVPGEAILRVPPMEIPANARSLPLDQLARQDAVALFAERARSVKPSFTLTDRNAHTVLSICERLDAIPLAIELASAWIRALTVEQIYAHLTDRLRFLVGPAGQPVERHRTLQSAIDWSYQLLDEGDQRMFRQLSVFAGSFNLAAVERVIGPGERALDDSQGSMPESALSRLLRLVDKSLVTADDVGAPEMRYRLLECLREYAAVRLRESGEEMDTRNAHRDYFLEIAEEAEPHLRGAEQAEWLDRLTREIDNLRAALAWSVDPVDRLRLATSLWRYWIYRGNAAEGRSWIEGALAHQPNAPTTLMLKALNGAGVLAQVQKDFEGARSLLTMGLEMSRQVGSAGSEASFLNNLGILASAQRDLGAAQILLRQSLAIYRKEALRDPSYETGVADTALNLGNIASELSQQQDARSYYREALDIYMRAADQLHTSVCLCNLAIVEQKDGHDVLAEQMVREAADLAWSAGYHVLLPNCCSCLAEILTDRGLYAQAAWFLGSIEAMRDRLQILLDPTLVRNVEEVSARLREAMTEADYRNAWSLGNAAPIEEVFRRASPEAADRP